MRPHPHPTHSQIRHWGPPVRICLFAWTPAVHRCVAAILKNGRHRLRLTIIYHKYPQWRRHHGGTARTGTPVPPTLQKCGARGHNRNIEKSRLICVDYFQIWYYVRINTLNLKNTQEWPWNRLRPRLRTIAIFIVQSKLDFNKSRTVLLVLLLNPQVHALTPLLFSDLYTGSKPMNESSISCFFLGYIIKFYYCSTWLSP